MMAPQFPIIYFHRHRTTASISLFSFVTNVCIIVENVQIDVSHFEEIIIDWKKDKKKGAILFLFMSIK